MLNSSNTHASTSDTFDFVILGGGLAGLVAGRELAQQGYAVAIVEKNSVVGGLAQTLVFDGFRFDLGGHRFHSNNVDVVNWLKALLGEELLTVPRQSHIFLNQNYVRYPLEFPDSLFAFGFGEAGRMAVSYAKAQLTAGSGQDISFEDWVVNRFGRRMFTHFFEPYTEKVWGIGCDELSADWASQRIGLPSFKAMLMQTIRPETETPATAISEFYYPRMGFGSIPKKLNASFLSSGGTQYLNNTIDSISRHKNQYKLTLASGETLFTSHIISTIPLNHLIKLLPQSDTQPPVNALSYRGLITVFLGLNQEKVSDDSWTYFPDREIVFGRIHEPKNWSSSLIPNLNQTSLCVEIFASPNEAIWQQPDSVIVEKTIRELDKLGLTSQEAFINGWVHRLPHAYPIYKIGYETQLSSMKAFVNQFPNIHLAGRTGSFRYLNSDGVIENIFDLISPWINKQQIDVDPLQQETGRWI